MRTIILASATALLLSGSLANAQFLLGQDEFGHKQVRNLWAERSVGARETRLAPRRFAAPIPGDRFDISTTSAGRVTPGLLLGQDEFGHKTVINQYAR